jgi:hypothetical protein
MHAWPISILIEIGLLVLEKIFQHKHNHVEMVFPNVVPPIPCGPDLNNNLNKLESGLCQEAFDVNLQACLRSYLRTKTYPKYVLGHILVLSQFLEAFLNQETP